MKFPKGIINNFKEPMIVFAKEYYNYSREDVNLNPNQLKETWLKHYLRRTIFIRTSYVLKDLIISKFNKVLPNFILFNLSPFLYFANINRVFDQSFS